MTADKTAQRPQRRAGLDARRFAVDAIHNVTVRRMPLDEAFGVAGRAEGVAALEPRDRAFARLLAMTVLRRRGELRHVLAGYLERPLPEDRGQLDAILEAGAAQLLFLGTPPHAAIDLAVDQVGRDAHARRFGRLSNAVLRRISETGAKRLEGTDGPRLNTPDWLWSRWCASYGEATARTIAAANLVEPNLDVSVASEAATWAATLGGTVLPTGTVRIADAGQIAQLPGFDGGRWWVQDAAAALPARMLGCVAGLDVADLGAAPGGKTMQLASAGARVTAVDQSERRLRRLAENLARTGLAAQTVVADILTWSPGRQFPRVLLDAPCSATGTIRRHPDILSIRGEADVVRLAEIQAQLFSAAAKLVAPGGTLVYCSCSLEPEEGERQTSAFLAANADFAILAVGHADLGIPPECMTPRGELRTLPHHALGPDPLLGGLDGFYAVRLERRS